MNPKIGEAGKPYRFKPGQSGNPKGASKKQNLLDLLKAELGKSDGPSGETNGEYLIHRLVQRACHGDTRCLQLVLEYMLGKPSSPVAYDIREQARRIAAERGLDMDALVRRAELIANRKA